MKQRFQVRSKCAERMQWPFLFAVFSFCSLHGRDPDIRGSDGPRLCWRGNKWACPTSTGAGNVCGREPGPGEMCVAERPLVPESGSCIACSSGRREAKGTLSLKAQGLLGRSCLSSAVQGVREDSKELQAGKLKELILWLGEIKRAYGFCIDMRP